MFIDGLYLDGKTSKPVNARLEVSPFNNTVCVCTQDTNTPVKRQSFNFSALAIESRLGNTPREILFGESQLFTTEDNTAVEQLSALLDTPTSVLHKLESNLSLIVFSAITIVFIIWMLFSQGIPYAAKTIAFSLPEFTTEKLGESLSILDKIVFEPSQLEPDKQQKIKDFLSPYIESFSNISPTLQFRSAMKANAFALPGGDIVLTDDFVNLTENNEELLAVFFHEIGHLQHKHITRRALQGSMVTLLVVFITGDLDTLDLLTGIPTLLLDLSYSREFEIEADTFALEQMQRHNISIEHFSSIMQKLSNYNRNESHTQNIDKNISTNHHYILDFLSTHPPTQKRLALIEKYQHQHRQ